MAESTTPIAENIGKIRQEIAKIAAECGRDAAAIDLIAISKFHPIDAVSEAIAAGHYSFGENRVQEAMGKFSDLRLSKNTETSPRLRLHLVGSLQSNKAREAAQFFDEIHSLDRPSL
ncbi:MAG: YggS family pyridoxal phosphate-dependent enzyme, partial [Alphaproteobacteria bacterium]|nr:YggS family pyridoxal phosphate-dependent enzyme [Alphaproteobacteria bacterium]